MKIRLDVGLLLSCKCTLSLVVCGRPPETSLPSQTQASRFSVCPREKQGLRYTRFHPTTPGSCRNSSIQCIGNTEQSHSNATRDWKQCASVLPRSRIQMPCSRWPRCRVAFCCCCLLLLKRASSWLWKWLYPFWPTVCGPVLNQVSWFCLTLLDEEDKKKRTKKSLF